MKRATKGTLYFIIVVTIVILGTVAVLRFQSERVAIRLGDYVTAKIGSDRNLVVEIGDIGGSFLRDIRLKDVCLSYVGGEVPRVLLSAPEVYLKFNLFTLLRKQVEIDSIHITSPHLVIPLAADGSRIYPTGDKARSKGKPSPLRIRHMTIENASVIWQDHTPRVISDINLTASLAKQENVTRLSVERCNFKYQDHMVIRSLAGILEILPDRLVLGKTALETPSSKLTVEGFFGISDNDSLRVSLFADSLDVGELATALKGSPQPEGRISGKVIASGTRKNLKFSLGIAGNIDDWYFDDLKGKASYGRKTLRIASLRGVLNGAPIRLSGRYILSDPPRYAGIVGFSGLDLSQFIASTSGRYASDLAGSIRFEGEAFDRRRFRLAIFPRLTRGRYESWKFDGLAGKATFDASSVRLDSVTAWVESTKVTTTGTIEFDGDTWLDFAFDSDNLADLERYYGVKGLRGKTHGHGHFTYQYGTSLVEVSSVGRAIEYGGSRLDSVDLSLKLVHEAEELKGEASIFGRKVTIKELRGKELLADLEIDGKRIAIKRLVLTRPSDEHIGAIGSIALKPKGFDISIDHLLFETGSYVWETPQAFNVSYRQDSVSIDDFDLVSSIGRLKFSNASYVGGIYHLALGIEELNLGSLKQVFTAGIPTGLLDLTLEIAGSYESLTFASGFEIANGEIMGVRYDRLSGKLNYDGKMLRVDRLNLSQNGGKVDLSGFMPIDLSPAAISSHSKHGNLQALIQDLGEFEIATASMDISILRPLLPPLRKLSGYADLKMTVSGSKTTPRIVTEGELRQAQYGNVGLGEIKWSVIYEDSLLRIAHLNFGRKDQRGEIAGVFPIAISILPFESEVLESPMNISIKAQNGDLGLLCEVIPKLKVCRGSYFSDLRIAGTIKDPEFYGSVKLSNARLRIEGVAQDLRSIFLDAEADGKRFIIHNLKAEDGALAGSGFIEMQQLAITNWHVALKFDDYRLTEFEDLYARLYGGIEIDAERLENGRVVPLITGKVKIREGEYFYALGGEGGEFMGPTTNPSWLLNVEIEIPNAFWIRGNDIEAELQGDLSVKRTGQGLVVLGTLRTLRGKFYVYHNSFRITSGEFRFADVTSLKKAYIDVEAEATVLDERIKIKASGYADNLDITATSESGWTETQIFEALTLRRKASEEGGGGVLSSAFLRSWALALANHLGNDVARELNLDQFGIEIEDTGEGSALAATRVTIGKYLMPNIYLQFSQSLGSLYGDRTRFTQRGLSYPERQFSVEYRLSDRFSIEGQTGTVGGLGYFDVDLKMKFGY